MVVSSACMMVAVMAQIVTIVRRRPGAATGAAAAVLMSVLCGHRRREAQQGGKRTPMAGVDRSVGAHARLQLLHELVVAVEIDPYRGPQHHLDEVAGGVLRRRDRKLRAGAGAERTHRALEDVVGERVDINGDGLTDSAI